MTENTIEASIREAEELAKQYPDETWYCIKFPNTFPPRFEVVKESFFSSNTYLNIGEPFPIYDTKTKKRFNPVTNRDGEIERIRK